MFPFDARVEIDAYLSRTQKINKRSPGRMFGLVKAFQVPKCNPTQRLCLVWDVRRREDPLAAQMTLIIQISRMGNPDRSSVDQFVIYILEGGLARMPRSSNDIRLAHSMWCFRRCLLSPALGVALSDRIGPRTHTSHQTLQCVCTQRALSKLTSQCS